jgi:Xaa-Pro aminopeptidase
MEKGTEKMSNVKITACPEWILQEEPEQAVKLSAGVYLRRLDALIERMDETDTDFVVIYGDREHFANIEYFTRYDCRFEEGLFIVSRNGNRTIVVGNEGEAYSKFIPYPVERIVYRHFSLQGQPRNGIQKLRDVYRQAGLKPDSRVGFVSVKYFEGDAADDPAHQFDAPEYMLTELYKVVDRANVVNYTREITGLPNGVRMRLREAEEIAFFEYQAAKAANVVRRLLLAAKPGMSETDIARHARTDLLPPMMHPLVNVTPESLGLALASPQHDCVMAGGEVFGICYSQRGSLCSKVGIAARGEEGVSPRLKGKVESFYMPHWEAIARWREALQVGTTGDELYRAAMDVIGDERFGVFLNPGHAVGMDEWTNSCVYAGSEIAIHSGSSIQTDIIASSPDEVMVSICEDTVVVAGAELRAELQRLYPDVYRRVQRRRAMMRETLGIRVSDDVLPLTALVGVMFPYMLDTTRVYALEN